jgi:NADPH:quinone reductase-like Zn-dependent oxidoreductase
VWIGGRRDGSLLVSLDVEPLLSRATDIEELLRAGDLYLLGFAHRNCRDLAARRLAAGEIALPDNLLPVRAELDQVTGLAPGDEVLTHPLPLRYQGAWAEWLVAPATLVASKPTVVSWETAAAFPVPALTADQALQEASPVPAGEWVLVHGAGGVTGGLAVQLATARGATVVATAGPASAARVRGYGARLVLDYHDPDLPAHVRDASPGGRGVTAAVNAVRGGAATALQAVARDGRLATITGDPPAPERGVAVADVYVRGDGARLAELVAALADEILSLHVAATLPLAEAATALRDAVTGRSKGANVLTLDRS